MGHGDCGAALMEVLGGGVRNMHKEGSASAWPTGSLGQQDQLWGHTVNRGEAEVGMRPTSPAGFSSPHPTPLPSYTVARVRVPWQ